MVPVFAYGPQAEQFGGIMENTDFFVKFKELLGLK
jgi:alkaline phosphatase